jgi:hypothetical protein
MLTVVASSDANKDPCVTLFTAKRPVRLQTYHLNVLSGVFVRFPFLEGCLLTASNRHGSDPQVVGSAPANHQVRCMLFLCTQVVSVQFASVSHCSTLNRSATHPMLKVTLCDIAKGDVR